MLIECNTKNSNFESTGRELSVLHLGRYRLLNTLLMVLPMVPPPCILLARASSRADCVTEASAFSLG